MLTLPVADMFGPTFQGEGPSAGRRAVFVRLGGCNLTCGHGASTRHRPVPGAWACDEAATWDGARHDLRATITPTPVATVAAFLDSTDTRLVVITGGEPLLHQHRPAFAELLACCAGRRVEVETNGTLIPTPRVLAAAHLNVSPKLANSGLPAAARLRPAALTAYAEAARGGRAVFKFVCRDPADVTEAAALIADLGVPASAVWAMPEGVTAAAVLEHARNIADAVSAAGWNLTLRGHVLLWPGQVSR